MQSLSRFSLHTLFAAVILSLLCGCASESTAKVAKRDLVIWGVSTGPDVKGTPGMIREFEKLHPDINVRVLSMGAGGMNSQKLMTSIVGNVAPDVVNQDRFSIADWASRGAFQPLDPLIARDKADPLDPHPSGYYPATWAEASFDGKVYGIPTGADNRVLYYNKDVFAERADDLRAAGLDPNRPPRTWSELLAYSKVLTEFNKDGSLKRAGYIPNAGNSWLYLYAFQNNASFMSADGRTCTLDSPAAEEALQFMQDGYQLVGGYQRSKDFESGFQTRENDPFLNGKLVMKVDGDWIDSDLSRYGPKVNFGTAAPPVPDDRFNHRGRFANEKDTFITWVGGFAYVIPRGAHNVTDAWEFIKFATSVKGRLIEAATQSAWDQHLGRTFIPRQAANKEFNELQFVKFKPADERYAGSIKSHKDLMAFGRVRPPTFVSNLLWQEHVKAIDNALYGKYSIKDALKLGEVNVQRDLDAYYTRKQYPIVSLRKAGYVAGALFVLGVIGLFLAFKRLKLGRLATSEAKWAYLFVSPWVLGFVVFTLGPMLASLYFAFTQYNVLNPARFVGIRNFSEMVGPDRDNMVKAFSNAGYLAGVGVPLGLMTGLAVALLLNSAVRGMRFYRTFFYMPAIVPGVASTVLWSFILTSDPHKGLLNAGWHATIEPWLHAKPPGWLSSENWSKPALVMMGVWGAGSGMILWLAGLKGVPTSLYEASGLDGASPKQQFWNVTMPMLSPIIFFNIVMGFIGALQEFDRVFLLKSNDGPVGPADSLLVPVYHLFNNGFAFFKMGYASALAWVIFIVIFMLTVIQFVLARHWVHTETDK